MGLVETAMDTFERMVQMMAQMPPEEQRKALGTRRGMCICPGCPTYTDCAKNAGELLFCLTGKSFMCITDEEDCLCPSCPVTAEMGLKHTTFCIRGSEKAQRYESGL